MVEGASSLHATHAPHFDPPVALSPTPETERVTGYPLGYSPDDAKLAVAVYPPEHGAPYEMYVTFPCRNSGCAGQEPPAFRVASLPRPARIEFAEGSDGLLLFDENGTAWPGDDDVYYAAITNERAQEAQLLAAPAQQALFVGGGRGAIVQGADGVAFFDLARLSSGQPGARIALGPTSPAGVGLGPVAPDGARFLVWDKRSGSDEDTATLYEVESLLAGSYDGSPSRLTESTSIAHVSNDRVVVHGPAGYQVSRWDGSAPVDLGIEPSRQVAGCGDYLLATTGRSAEGSPAGLTVLRAPDAGGAPSSPLATPVVGVEAHDGGQFSGLHLDCLSDSRAVLVSQPVGDHFIDLSRAVARPFGLGRYLPRAAFNSDASLVAYSPLYSGRRPVGLSSIASTTTGAAIWRRESNNRDGAYRWLNDEPVMITNAPLQGERLPGLFEIDARNPAAVNIRRLRELVFGATLGAVSHDDRYVAYGAAAVSLPEVKPAAAGTYETDRLTGSTQHLGPSLQRPLRGVGSAVPIPGTRSLLLEGRFSRAETSALFVCNLAAPAEGCQRVLRDEMASRALAYQSGFVVSPGVSAAAWYVDSPAGALLARAKFGSDSANDISLTLAALQAPQPIFHYSTSPITGVVIAPDGAVVHAQGARLFHLDARTGVQVELDARDEPWPEGDRWNFPPGGVYIPNVTPAGRIVFARMNVPGTFVGMVEPGKLDVVHMLVPPAEDAATSYGLFENTELLWYTHDNEGETTFHVVDLATRNDRPVSFPSPSKPHERVSVCEMTPDRQTVLLNVDGSVFKVDLRSPASQPSHRATLLFEGQAYCDELWSDAGHTTSSLGLFVFRNPFASTVVRWDEAKPPFTLKLDGRDVRYARFSPDGRYLLARSEDDVHRWYRWDASNLHAAPVALPDSDEAYTLVFDPASRYLAIAKDDGIRVYELDRPDGVRIIAGGGAQSVQWVP